MAQDGLAILAEELDLVTKMDLHVKDEIYSDVGNVVGLSPIQTNERDSGINESNVGMKEQATASDNKAAYRVGHKNAEKKGNLGICYEYTSFPTFGFEYDLTKLYSYVVKASGYHIYRFGNNIESFWHLRSGVTVHRVRSSTTVRNIRRSVSLFLSNLFFSHQARLEALKPHHPTPPIDFANVHRHRHPIHRHPIHHLHSLHTFM
ncbi:unnamed protein product [Lactuca saligna]|uniref:Uncharacterized protein n=1 Tax=Lactuca saligna TaxID=75948 RepID=A0AA35VR04_LACSI|nr:unnamed protein product [Lactuca saligna]